MKNTTFGFKPYYKWNTFNTWDDEDCDFDEQQF